MSKNVIISRRRRQSARQEKERRKKPVAIGLSRFFSHPSLGSLGNYSGKSFARQIAGHTGRAQQQQQRRHNKCL